eukprot:5069008-Prymnesium_polylepis.1
MSYTSVTFSRWNRKNARPSLPGLVARNPLSPCTINSSVCIRTPDDGSSVQSVPSSSNLSIFPAFDVWMVVAIVSLESRRTPSPSTRTSVPVPSDPP